MSTPRPEYPRPQLERAEWQNLNGEWLFDFDDADCGLRERWHENHAYGQKITVPFAFQAPLSGIGTNDFHDIVWYERSFDVPTTWKDKQILLHFGAVDYRAIVWVNGQFVTHHEGGHVPFKADITAALKDGANRITVRVEDLAQDREQPRGKQYWERESASIFYTRTTGIWQTVWLEPVSKTHVDFFKLVPDIDTGELRFEFILSQFAPNTQISIEASYQSGHVAALTKSAEAARISGSLSLGAPADVHLWSPENPALYDLKIRVVQNGTAVDEINSYFGMRKIAIQDGKICLNNQPYYMRLVLDQGYHPEGILSFPSDEALKNDVELTKALGFNGARKHQKVEEPRYLYWADHLGLLVWGEMANAYAYSETAVKRITHEWQEAIQRDYNHPCIVAWVPINESWGVPELTSNVYQVEHLQALYHLVRSLDISRLVISNDGWEHARTDLLTIHDYEGSGEILTDRYSTLEKILSARPARRDLYALSFAYSGEPILVTEFGGIAYQKDAQQGWGYTTASEDGDFVARYRAVTDALLASPHVQGFCYTQLTDVEQEINGLLTYDRTPKVDMETIRKITAGE